MMNARAVVAALLLLLIAAVAGDQTAAPDSVATPGLNLTDADVQVDLWPPTLNAYGLVWVPNGTAADRTGLGLGLDTLLPYNLNNDLVSLTSELALSFTVTSKGQWRFIVGTDQHWNQNRNYARVRAGYDDLAREFFGIGPAAEESDLEVYGPRDLHGFVETTWRLGSRTLAVGPRFEYQHHDARNLEEGGQLESGEIPGVAGGALWSLGLVMNWDRRDDRYQPSEGWFIQSRFMRFTGTNTDNYRFWHLSLDWRAYRRVTDRQVLAGQLFIESVSDGAPFWRLASLGGHHYSRAYPLNRWIDDTLVSGQAEWRWQALRHWGLVGFAGAAVVGGSLSELQSRYLRPSVGVGIRYLTEQGSEVVPIRLDVAVGYQHWRVSLGLAEAF